MISEFAFGGSNNAARLGACCTQNACQSSSVHFGQCDDAVLFEIFRQASLASPIGDHGRLAADDEACHMNI